MFAVEETGGEQRRSPPVKVLSGQLRAAGNRAAAGSSGGEAFLIRAARGRSLRASLVWMQGTVMEAQLERNTVLLMDETGTFTVQGVNNIPRGKPCFFPGKYVMVMGVVEAVSPEPVVRAVKMADLSDFAALHRQMWKLEVEELQQLLT
ncbi:recQ-mediated genome instability protein 2 [Nematolebias whitei]|uniref:recQ-mediated genome instability protein 2 n=1 Tax=Nematolebias whitei TaxID=451745 RepID=UPI0018985FBD|nr:recQ-mediated genome instability protein 2 [Nematolebias whitei]